MRIRTRCGCLGDERALLLDHMRRPGSLRGSQPALHRCHKLGIAPLQLLLSLPPRRRQPARHCCRSAPPSPLLSGQALDKVLALVDPSDDMYSSQRALVDGDAAFYLTELLADPSVAPRAAEVVAQLCAHSAAARARLASGPLIGLDASVERVSLNPCQAGAWVAAGAGCWWLRLPLRGPAAFCMGCGNTLLCW